MLRDSKALSDAPASPRLRLLTVGVLTLAALLVAGFRGPTAPGAAIAQQAPAAEQGEAPERIDLRYIPREADLVIVLRVAELVDNPDWQPLVEIFGGEDGIMFGPIGILPIDQIEQVTVLMMSTTGLGDQGAILFKAREPQDWGALVEKMLNPPETFFEVDERTIVIGPEPHVEVVRDNHRRAQPPRAWEGALEAIEPGQLAVLAESSWFLRQPGTQATNDPLMGAFSPLFDKAYAYALSVDVRDGMTIEGAAACSSDQGAKQVAETLGALRTLARNALPSVGQQSGVSPDFRPILNLLVDQGETLLDAVEVQAEGRMVHLRSSADVEVANVVRVLQQAAQEDRAYRKAEFRAQSTNNLRQIGLALHNYHDTHGQLPPAVLIGPDGKTPHSWRVAILPFLDQAALYEQYRLDEPWDGPNNSKLLETIVPFYNVPGGNTDPTHADYFVLTAPETLFSADGEGTSLAEVTDGVSGTIAVVEARRPIPWTKPEDIPYEPEGPLPELGGFFDRGFNVLFADGAVRFLLETIDENVLRGLFTKSGGEVIQIPPGV